MRNEGYERSLVLITVQLKHQCAGLYLCSQRKLGPMCMPELGGTLSCLIDVMRTNLVLQVTEKPAGTHTA